MPLDLTTASPDFADGFNALLHAKREMSADVDAIVAGIIAAVKEKGDEALLDYTNRFDRMALTSADQLVVTADEIEEAVAKVPAELLAALDLAASRIEYFHSRQMPVDDHFTDAAGVRLGLRWTSVSAAGLYVPGGTAAYPSSVLMNALPAKVAGVQRIVMVVPTPDGVLNPAVMAAAKRAGVTDIFRVGGAQAVAALAHGTETIPQVDKIVGPGNAYVASAKRQVFGLVGIDSIAGPSEILVVADGANDPSWIAADLLSQAEHDESAQAILLTDDSAFADKVLAAVQAHLERLPRAVTARKSWDTHGAVIRLRSLDEAPALVDAVAPEHLELALEDPDAMAARIHHAGAIFLGRHTPEAIGDYVAGPNHVLPTARTARFSSGLSVFDFLKRTTLVGCDETSIRVIGPAAVTLARAEGLDAHALSVSVRLGEAN
ncbi:histidinol dehydrogenase [Zavarzinia sp.]|uniref:histidinol dehydrogenase n=1 Tax=Zavarzinia sp. TaxID=2027920 RepID=UPI00356756C2